MLALRTAAMRESLERVGRYTPERSRERLRAAFTPEHMRHLVAPDGRRMGFVTVLSEGDRALRLQHLYLHPDWRFYQRHGFVQTGEEDVDVHYEWRPEGWAE